ncbi:MAG: DUF547 domain-containing protein [bacterium]
MRRLLIGVIIGSLLFTVAWPGWAIEHEKYATVLQRHVVGGYFDYKEFMGNDDSREKLHQYLSNMSTISPQSLSDKEQLSYWMNLYNASTIRLIENNYPVDSIRDLDGWVTTAFQKEFIEVGKKTYTLDNVEHDIIRERFDEPRIHFALVCAAKSCPPLRHEPYVADKLDTQLRHQTNVFLSSDKNRFSIRENTLYMKVSNILNWYGEDFGGEKGVAKFIGKYRPGQVGKYVVNENYTIQYQDYNWSLNQAPGPYKQITP